MLSYLETMASTAGRAKTLLDHLERIVQDTESRIIQIRDTDRGTTILFELRTQVERMRQEKDLLRQEIKDMMAWKKNETNLERRVEELSDTEKQLTQRNQNLQQENDELTRDKQSLENRLAAVKTEVHDRRSEGEELARNTEAIRSSVVQLREEEKMLMRRNQTHRQGIQALIDEEKETEQRCDAARKRLQAQKESEQDQTSAPEDLINERGTDDAQNPLPASSSSAQPRPLSSLLQQRSTSPVNTHSPLLPS